jgi:signal transduction histidine kinase
MRVGKQLTIGFGTVIAATLLTGVLAVAALYRIATDKDVMARDYAEDLAAVEDLRYHAEQAAAASRRHPNRFQTADDAFQASWREVGAESEHERRDLEQVQVAWGDYLSAVRTGLDNDDDPRVSPARRSLEARLDALVDDERHDWEIAFERSRDSARRTMFQLAATTLFGVAASLVLSLAIRRRLDEQFTRKEEAVSGRDEVLAVVSHDLRNPLSSIILASQLAVRQGKHGFERIHGAALRMNRMIEDLVEAARVESGGLRLKKRQCDVTPLISQTLQLFEEQAAEKAIRLESQLPAHATAVVDPERIGRVLTNLFGNALKFTPPGGCITVRAQPEQSHVRVSVSDDGPGLRPEQLPYLFEKYWQARRGGQGLGLGLYIVKSLIEAHGGAIWVETAPGEGATFTFRLPTS